MFAKSFAADAPRRHLTRAAFRFLALSSRSGRGERGRLGGAEIKRLRVRSRSRGTRLAAALPYAPARGKLRSVPPGSTPPDTPWTNFIRRRVQLTHGQFNLPQLSADMSAVGYNVTPPRIPCFALPAVAPGVEGGLLGHSKSFYRRCKNGEMALRKNLQTSDVSPKNFPCSVTSRFRSDHFAGRNGAETDVWRPFESLRGSFFELSGAFFRPLTPS